MECQSRLGVRERGGNRNVEFGVVGWIHLEGDGIFTRIPCDVRVKMRTQL